MRDSIRSVVLAASLLLSACSSSSPEPEKDASVAIDAAPGVGQDAPPVADGAPDTNGAASPDATTARDAGGETAAADAGSVMASEACMKFCTCMAKNCADKMFPRGCLTECASTPKWDLACRQVMCTLVPDQPNNNHCVHAMGVQECLDKP
jgi:hypothetical protein